MHNEIIHGGDVYRNDVRLDFSVSLNPMPVPPEIREAAVRGIDAMHLYPDPIQEELRREIAALEGADPGQVICGSGASELVMAIVHAAMPGRALVTAPCYSGYSYALNAVNAEIAEYSLDPGEEFSLDSGFLSMIGNDTDIVFIGNPNNPSGRLIDRDVLDEIARMCREAGALLVIDECFLPLTDRYNERPDLSDGAVHLRAFTKTLAMPGLRAGYMTTSDAELMEAVRKNLPEWNLSIVSQNAGTEAARLLRDTDFLEKSNRLIRTEREYLAGRIDALGIRVFHSDTNYLLLRTDMDIYRGLLEQGILIRRCANFHGLGSDYYRIAVRRREDNDALLEALRYCVK